MCEQSESSWCKPLASCGAAWKHEYLNELEYKWASEANKDFLGREHKQKPQNLTKVSGKEV